MTENEIKTALRILFSAMADFKTNKFVDRKGVVWTYDRWYGEPAHFRAGVGHFSEMVLTDEMLEDRMPFRVHLDESPASPDDEAWRAHFLAPLGDAKE